MLGILESDFSLAAVDRDIKEQAIYITVYAVVLMGVIAVILYVVLRTFVLKPVTSLSSAMGTLRGGTSNARSRRRRKTKSAGSSIPSMP